MIRSDQVAGAFLIGVGIIIFALSGDLPFGSLAFPGAGFVPKVIASLIIGLGALLAAIGVTSTPVAALGWDDLRHACTIFVITAAATALYARIGFVITLAAMMLVILVGVERKGIVPAGIYTCTIVGLSYVLFTVLRAPIPSGPFGF